MTTKGNAKASSADPAEVSPIHTGGQFRSRTGRRRRNNFSIPRWRKWQQFIFKSLGTNKIIARESCVCLRCQELLCQMELVVETSNFGERRVSYLRFNSEKLEDRYERHLLEAHGLRK